MRIIDLLFGGWRGVCTRRAHAGDAHTPHSISASEIPGEDPQILLCHETKHESSLSCDFVALQLLCLENSQKGEIRENAEEILVGEKQA